MLSQHDLSDVLSSPQPRAFHLPSRPTIESVLAHRSILMLQNLIPVGSKDRAQARPFEGRRFKPKGCTFLPTQGASSCRVRAPGAPKFAPGGTCLDRWSHAVHTPISHGQLERAILGYWGKIRMKSQWEFLVRTFCSKDSPRVWPGALPDAVHMELFDFHPKWVCKAAGRGGAH